MPDSSTTKWSLWLQWTLASGVGAGVFASVARPVSMALGGGAGQAMGPIVAEAVTGALALGGVMLGIGIGQCLVVRRHISWAGLLVLAMAVGGAMGGAVGLGAWAAVTRVAGPAAGVAVAVVVGLVTFGIAQWFVLRRHLSWAGRWAAASIIGLVAATLGLVLIASVLGDGFGAEYGSGVAYGAAYGGVTGGALTIFGRPR